LCLNQIIKKTFVPLCINILFLKHSNESTCWNNLQTGMTTNPTAFLCCEEQLTYQSLRSSISLGSLCYQMLCDTMVLFEYPFYKHYFYLSIHSLELRRRMPFFICFATNLIYCAWCSYSVSFSLLNLISNCASVSRTLIF
jgi:hypothetical protein